MKNTIKIVVWNAGLTLLIVFAIEMTGSFGYYLIKGRFHFEKVTFFEEHPYLSGAPKKNYRLTNYRNSKQITTDWDGFRITGQAENSRADAIKVVCLGGSTTFGTQVSDEETWPYLLQQKLGSGYKVYNLGAPGYSTMEASIQLLSIVPELQPDIVINYHGWNDIKNYHVNGNYPDYYQHGMFQKEVLQVQCPKLLEYSFIFYLTRRVSPKVFSAIYNPITIPKTDPEIDSLFARNLRNIQLLCTNLKTRQIYIPQVLNFKYLARSGNNDLWSPHIKDKDMPVFMNAFNVLMINTIQENEQAVILDSINTKYEWPEQFFEDVGHFNVKGGMQFANIVAEEVVKQKPKAKHK